MKIYYDLHIHTALSPCGDADMTPNNIVNMATIIGLDCIAVTDHNTCGNALAVIKAAKSVNPSLIVIPGMEAETSEEIHTVCLFPDYISAEAFGQFIDENLAYVKNDPKIFGEQVFYNERDEQIAVFDKLLLTATSIDLYKMVKTARDFGGVCIPAHIDRNSYSVLSSLGFIPPDLDINIVEISARSDAGSFLSKNKRLLIREFGHIQSSDAHYLADISEKEHFIEVQPKNQNVCAEDIINCLKMLK